MKLAVMQPYFFPYVGYWQLMSAVDKFVLYEDVNYIKRGWINRNTIPVNGKPCFLTVPLKQASQHKKICQLEIAEETRWREKMLRTIQVNYARAPFYDAMVPLLEEIIHYDVVSLSEFLGFALRRVGKSLGISSAIVSSTDYANRDKTGAKRIIDICRREGADTYINAIGGRGMYRREDFQEIGVELRFLDTQVAPAQLPHGGDGVHFSILHLLMTEGFAGVAAMLPRYQLLPASSDSVKQRSASAR